MFAEFDWVEATRSSPIMLVLLVCSVVTMAVTIERLLYYRRRSGSADLTLHRALESVGKGKANEAVLQCQHSNHPMGHVASMVLGDGKHLPSEPEERLQIALSQEKLVLEKNLSILGSMAAVAPLIGLLGTVWGIMRAFHDMAEVGSAAPSVVAAGVAEALLTTAAGLVIAVPAVLLYNHFARRMSVMLTVAENHTRSLRAAIDEFQIQLAIPPKQASRDVGRIESAIAQPETQPAAQPSR